MTNRTGRWGGSDFGDSTTLPKEVHEAFVEEDPEWDWTYMVAEGEQYFIARLFDEGEEEERLLCKVVARRVTG